MVYNYPEKGYTRKTQTERGVYTEREQKNKGESPTGIPQFLLITILLRIRDIF